MVLALDKNDSELLCDSALAINGIIWDKIKDSIIDEYPESRHWIKGITYKEFSHDGIIILTSKSRFEKDWIERHYIDLICARWNKCNKNVKQINITISEEKKFTILESLNTNPVNYIATNANENAHYDIYNVQNSFSSQLDPKFTFESFVVAKPNEFAFNAVKMMAETNGPLQNSNPLFIRGDVGLGKTHLMHAAGWHIKKINPNRKVVYLSAEKFMYQFITSLRNKDIFNFKEYFRSADVFMVDDVQFIGGKESTQEEFFHTFNELINSNKQLVFSADRPPCELKTIEERIRSRLNCGLVVGINATTFELRLGILQSKINDMNMYFSNDILEYLAANINSNVRELEGALNRIIAYSKYNNAEITIDMARSILSDMIGNNNKVEITINDIKKHVAEYFNIEIEAMCSASRVKKFTVPRQAAMFLSKVLTTKSFPEIGRAFGKRDHTTVMHACKKIEKQKKLNNNNQEWQDIENIRHKICLY